MTGFTKCEKCDGCGKVANTDEQEPWTWWEDLPPGNDIAVWMGIVRPVECPECHGTGKTAQKDVENTCK